MSTMDKEKAMKDLLAIRSTMDKMSGAEIFRDFIYSMGSLLIVFGVLIILAIGATWYLNTFEIPNAGRWIAALWITLMVSGGTFKTMLFAKRGKKHGLSFNEYLKKVLNKTFFGVDLPLEFALLIIIAYFLKIGEPQMVLPTIALGTGMLFGNLGHVFAEKRLVVFGYIFLAVAAVGFLCHCINFYVFSIVAFGVMYVAWGLALHGKSRELELESKEQSDED